MDEERIVIEAKSLQAAREELESRIAQDQYVVSEQVIADGQPQTVTATADTVEAAFAEAQSQVPGEASVLEKKERSSPIQQTILVEAFDEVTARSVAGTEARRQFGGGFTLQNVGLTVHGRKGLLGIGKKPNRYEVEVCRLAMVEITFRQEAKIAAQIARKRSPEEQIESFIADLENQLGFSVTVVSRALAKIDAPHVTEAFVAALSYGSVKVRKHAIGAVDSISNTRFLASTQPDMKNWQEDPDMQVPIEIGDARIVKALVKVLSDDELDADDRKSAIDVLGNLGRMGDARVVKPLISALDDKAWSVQFQAASQLVWVYRDGRLNKTHARRILAQVPTIRSVLPPERIQSLRNGGFWPF